MFDWAGQWSPAEAAVSAGLRASPRQPRGTMQTKWFLIVTAFAEAGTGLCLLVLPAVPIALLLGLTQAAPETLLICRIAGAALLCIGIASCLARNDQRTPAQLGLLTGILLYDLAAAVLLGFAGVALNMVGLALWPAVVLHALLAAWCVVEYLSSKDGASTATPPGASAKLSGKKEENKVADGS